ncbi:MAG: HAD-IA family hydrolase, partial [Novosphingobium sp.]
MHAERIARYASHWLDSLPGPVAGTHELVVRLAACHVPQYAITNFGVDAWRLFRPTFPVLDVFEDIVVSGIERLIKPDPAIFVHTLEKLGSPSPGEVFFIDDSEKNTHAADALGFRTH